jgi:hypothetical protein
MIKKILFLLLLIVVCLQFFAAPVKGDYSRCVVNSTPSSIGSSSTTSVIFNITNQHYDNNAEIVWLKVISPSNNFYIEGSGGDGSQIVKTVSIPVGTSSDQSLSITASSEIVPSAYWTVMTATDANGSDAISCTGNLGIAITGTEAELAISNISIANNSATSVTINWDTNVEANSYVYYGLTSGYGSVGSNSEYTRSHSITLSDLFVGTTYMYYLQGTSRSSSTVNSAEGAFNTASGVVGITPTATPTGTSTGTTTTVRTITSAPTPTLTPTPTPVPDRTRPSISVSQDFSKPFVVTPLISGKAADNIGLGKIEYSIDDGKNWLPVDTVDNPGTKTTNYSFTPGIYEDGNYLLKTRARDTSGNIGNSDTYILIVDRLPPQIGSVMFSSGVQVLIPNEDGAIFSLPSMDQKITLSAVGGPTNIDILSDNKTYTLTKNDDNGLWSGVLNFDNPGTYTFIAKAVDGAKNKTERKLNKIVVLDSGKVVSNLSPITSGKVTLWVFDDQTNSFVIWDGKSSGQANPQEITKDGEYGFFAPSGRYYLEVKSFGFKILKTDIFTLDKSMPVTPQLKLERSFGINFGLFVIPLPDFFISKQSVSIKSPVIHSETQSSSSIVGSSFPNVDIFLNGKAVSTIFFRGKPTIFTFLSTWSPYVSEQLEAIKEISANSSINIVPVVSQETTTSVTVFNKRGEYPFPIYSDPDGLLVKPFNLSFLPTSVFVDEKRIIRKIKVGILTKNELIDVLGKL